MEQVPAPMMVTVASDIAQAAESFETKATGKPDDEVAVIVNGGTPTLVSLNNGKVIVCGIGVAGVTVKVPIDASEAPFEYPEPGPKT